VRPVALGALILVLIPAWYAYDLASRLRNRGRSATEIMIPRVSIDDIDLDEVLAGAQPMILQGLGDRLALEHRPDLAGLRDLAATNTEPFKVRIHNSDAPYFLYTGDYGAEVDRIEKMTLDQFLDHMFVDEPDPATCTYQLFSVRDLHGAVQTVIDEMADKIGTIAGRTPERHASGIWIGSTGVVTPLHHDAWTGLLFQIEGSKRVKMFGPADRANLHLSSPFAPTSRWSRLPARSSEADSAAFPRFAKAIAHIGQLNAGETLFIPRYWMHEVEALEPNISIPFRFATRPLEYANPGFLRPAVEIFHGKYLADRATR
jgi:hypothetical protein